MEWLRLPLQPTTANSGAPAHFCSLAKFHIAGVRPPLDGGYWPVSEHSGIVGKYQWPNLKVSNFEQTTAVHICCFSNYRGIALSGSNPTPPSIIGLGGVVLFRV